MNGVTGKVKEQKQFEDFKKFIGLFKSEVVAVNPTREELNEILGLEPKDGEKEIEYLKEKEGVDMVTLTFWLKVDGQKDTFLPFRINLKNEIRRDKEGKKIELVNSTGDTQWLEADEDNNYDEGLLWDSFTHFTNTTMYELKSGDRSEKWQAGAKPVEFEKLAPKRYRPALVGESELYEFMKSWLSNIDLKFPGNEEYPPANLLLDMEELLAGRYEQLQSLIDSPLATNTYKDQTYRIGFVGLAYVRTDRDDPNKQYQQVFKKFLPSTFMKHINNNLSFPKGFALDKWNKFIKEVEGEYGVDGDYILEPLKEYDPNMDIAASNKTRPDVEDPNYKKSNKY
jgi:hypothetical protein